MPTPSEKSFSKRLEILATISHEIRNPLNAIIGLSHLLKNPVSEEERENYIDGLLETSEHLLDLLNKIMDFGKLESDNFFLHYEPTNLQKTITQSLLSQKAIAETKNLKFEIEVDENLPSYVIVDPVKLSQVIINLVSNAIKFTADGLVILQVKAGKLTDKEVVVNFSVKDTGIGIPEENLGSILEPFHQGSYDTSITYGGTGLGLSICKKIINKMGGELQVNSSLNKGSEFHFSLKLDIDQSTEKLSSQNNRFTDGASRKKLRILIVDDNKMNVLVAEKHLELWGFDSEAAYNGVEAVKKIRAKDFDLVLMDLHMPQMDGIQAVQLIRQMPEDKYNKLPIIGLTASMEKFIGENVSPTGFTDLVNKPFRPEELLEKILAHTNENNPSTKELSGKIEEVKNNEASLTSFP